MIDTDKIQHNFIKRIVNMKECGLSDYEGSFNKYLVFVDFDILSFKRLKIKCIEVLSKEYDLLITETALLMPFIEEIISEYNNEIESSLTDGYSIKEELERERYYDNKYQY